MRLEHAAVWVSDLERTRRFYAAYFGAESGALYENPRKQFSSYFLTFPDGGARLEIMHTPGRQPVDDGALGYAHLAISLGSPEAVDALVARLRAEDIPILDGPRTTGDGYYEAVVLDPDGNRIEITV